MHHSRPIIRLGAEALPPVGEGVMEVLEGVVDEAEEGEVISRSTVLLGLLDHGSRVVSLLEAGVLLYPRRRMPFR